ncbi:hypothetical protein [Streptomyces sp. NPDC087294]|uniref:hypothetical protein n=1 Tax=Streptomyces sp. NPDC087294 TaxID=3365777 RepID=UPI00382E6D5D
MAESTAVGPPDRKDSAMWIFQRPSPFLPLPREEIRARLLPWITTRDIVGSAPYGHLRPLAPGLCDVLTLDLDNAALPLPDEHLDSLGELDDLRDRALANLRALPVERHAVLRGAGSIRFDVVRGASVFTSSRALALDALIEQLTGAETGPDGALVAMPDRHQLAFRALEFPRDTSLVGTLNALAAHARAAFEGSAVRVSPDVYWWREGTLTRLVHHDAGRPEFTEDGAFEKLVRRLAETTEHNARTY